MTVRSLWNWEREAGEPEMVLGRPPHSPAAHARAHAIIAELETTIGHTASWRAVEARVDLPRRLIEPAVRALKASDRAHVRTHRAAHRVQHVVRAAGTILGQDSTHLGVCAHRGVWAEIHRDWATLAISAGGDGEPLDEAAMLGHLDRLIAEGRLPLVLAQDNGAPHWTPRVKARLTELKVVHLGNRAYVAQDNSPTERGIGEAKPEARLGRGVLLDTAIDGVRMMQAACGRLNARPRGSRGDLSAMELTCVLPSWETLVGRSEFFEAAQAAIQRAVQDDMTKREQRFAEREAIFATLEFFGLLSRVRGGGGRAAQALKPEMIS